MQVFEVLLIGLALSMDAMAVTAANTLAYSDLSAKKRWLMPAAFGFFQGLMPILGYLLGTLIADVVALLAPYIMLIVLGILGAKMLFDGIKELRCKKEAGDDCDEEKKRPYMSLIVPQAIATSIDALAVGAGFAVNGSPLWGPAALIALTTFCLCALVMLLAKKFSRLFQGYEGILGGAILLLVAMLSLF